MKTDPTNISLPLKAVIGIVMWVLSMAGMYYAVTSDLRELKTDNAVLKDQLKAHNLELIDYKITEIKKQQDEINENTKRVMDLLSPHH